MTDSEQTAYEMELALAEQATVQEIEITNEQFYYLCRLAMNPCIDAPERLRPIVLHEVAAFLEKIVRGRGCRFQPMMRGRLETCYEAFCKRVQPYLVDGQQSRGAARAARAELKAAI